MRAMDKIKGTIINQSSVEVVSSERKTVSAHLPQLNRKFSFRRVYILIATNTDARRGVP